MAEEKIRESVIAGSWYPEDPGVLRRDIRRYLDQGECAPLSGELVGLIAPHAGYMYSGAVAASAYRQLQPGSFDRVLIVAPSHRAPFHGASVYSLGGFRTPLGIVPLDREVVQALMERSPLIDYFPEAHAREHSLEIQLPFLQVALGEFQLTPIVMGDQSFKAARMLADAIAQACLGKRLLLVASSDLSHYYSYGEAVKLDRVAADRVAAFDAEGLWRSLQQGECEACGGGPMVSVMLAARQCGAKLATVLHYANSGDVTGDRSQGVVGYMAAAFTRSEEERS